MQIDIDPIDLARIAVMALYPGAGAPEVEMSTLANLALQAAIHAKIVTVDATFAHVSALRRVFDRDLLANHDPETLAGYEANARNASTLLEQAIRDEVQSASYARHIVSRMLDANPDPWIESTIARLAPPILISRGRDPHEWTTWQF